MKKLTQAKLVIIGLIALLSGISFFWFLNRYAFRPRAAEEKVNVTFVPKEGSFTVGEEKVLEVIIKPANAEKKISAVDLSFLTEGKISILTIGYPQPFPLVSPAPNVNQVISEIKENEARASYIFLEQENQLPSAVSLKVSFKGTAAGSGKIKIDTAKSQVVGPIENNLYSFGNVDEGSFTFGGENPTAVPISPPVGPSILVEVEPRKITAPLAQEFYVYFGVGQTPINYHVSGFDAKLQFDKDFLQIVSLGEPTDGIPEGTGRFTKIIKEFDNKAGTIHLSYISIQPKEQLPKTAVLEMKVVGNKVGKTVFKVLSAQVTGDIPQNNYQVRTADSTITIEPLVSITPSPAPTGGPVGNVELNLKLKFQGITKKPTDPYNKLLVKVFPVSSGGEKSCGQGQFSANEKGIWSATVSSWDTTTKECIAPQPGSNFQILIKGPKHLQKKICDPAPSEQYPGSYGCQIGKKITLTAGENNLDFSGIYLLVGDLPEQDGLVDSYDISYIRNSLGKSDPKTLAVADLNLDGIVDTQDYSLVIAALSIRYDEEE